MYTITKWSEHHIINGILHKLDVRVMFEENHNPSYEFCYKTRRGEIDHRKGSSLTGFIKKAVNDALIHRAKDVSIWLDAKYDFREKEKQNNVDN